MKDIVIVGAGGFGREVAWLIERINTVKPTWNILGAVDEDPSKEFGRYGVVGNDEWLLSHEGPIAVAVAVGGARLRKRICERLRANPRVEFPNLIDPSVMYADDLELGVGNIVCAGTIVTVGVAIADFCIVNLDCTIGHDARLDDYVTLYPSVNVSGTTALGECVEIGTGSQIIQLKSVGEGSIVGAGAVVSGDIPAHCTAVGVPARPIKFHRERQSANGH